MLNINEFKQKKDHLNYQNTSSKQDDETEKKLLFWRIITNIILSISLITIFYMMWNIFNTWKLIFFITLWSFWSNTFYIISITIIDIFIYKEKCKCERFNNLIRNDFLRIFFPFSVGTVIIYWELFLLGNNYIDVSYTVLDITKNFFMHGLVLIFVLFDVFTSYHINKNNNYKRDLIIISIIMILHFTIIIICKEFLNFYHWNFLIIADFRQIIGAFIIMYIIILNGYVILYLISENFFFKKEQQQEQKVNNNQIFDEKNDFEEKMSKKSEEKNKEKENNDEDKNSNEQNKIDIKEGKNENEKEDNKKDKNKEEKGDKKENKEEKKEIINNDKFIRIIKKKK